MPITKRNFGSLPDGRVVYSFMMENAKGMRVEILNFGCIIRSIFVPDRNGEFDDIVLGFESLEEYMINVPSFGACVGRLVGPVPDCRLEIGDEVFMLEPSNEEGVHMHGGKKGFSRSLWEAQTEEDNKYSRISLSLVSPDGDDSYPGELHAKVIYTLTEDNTLKVDYTAEADRNTLFNPTNHSYFNLSGHKSGYIGNQVASMAHRAAFVNGCAMPVKDTPLDLNIPHPLRVGLESGSPYLSGGYDHFHVLSGSGYRPVLCVNDPDSGRTMQVFTDCTGAIFYTGNYLFDYAGKNGMVYRRSYGFCFEPCFVREEIPFNPSHARIVGPSQTFSASTAYRFSVD